MCFTTRVLIGRGVSSTFHFPNTGRSYTEQKNNFAIGSEWAVRVGQRLPSRSVQSGAAREINLSQIVVEAPAIRGGLPST